MTENARPSRLRFRLRTILFVVAILALLLVVVIQQVHIGRMRRSLDEKAIQVEQLQPMIRELRDHLERH
jgi:hypothetical protein